MRHGEFGKTIGPATARKTAITRMIRPISPPLGLRDICFQNCFHGEKSMRGSTMR